MVQLRHRQQNLGEVFFAREAESLMEAWMKEVDAILEDEQLLHLVYEQLGRRHPQSRKRGRNSTPAEVVLRLMVLKHVRNWSYDVLEREVKANLVYRMFTRIGTATVPDAKTLGRLGRDLGSPIVEQIHQRLVEIARQRHLVQGRKMRLDTTVTEANIHYPTDSSLLGDGARVLTRIMKQISGLVGEQGTRVRDRLRTIGYRVMEIARLSRSKGKEQKERLREKYRELVRLTRQVRNQAQRFSDVSGGEDGSIMAVLGGDPQRSQARGESAAAGGAARDEAGVGRDDSAGQPGAATNHRAGVSGHHRHARQDRQRVRTQDGNHPQGQSEQADRVRQAGEDSGSRESDHYPLCGVPAAAGRLDFAARSGAAPSATAGPGARAVGRRCRFLLGGK